MFELIKIKGFRGFEAIEIAGLTRVNLFVGANNAGKTSALEAIELLAGGPDHGVIEGVLTRRGEYTRGRNPRSKAYFDFRGLFFGRNPEVGTTVDIRSSRRERFTARLGPDNPPDEASESVRELQLLLDEVESLQQGTAGGVDEYTPVSLRIDTHLGATLLLSATMRGLVRLSTASGTRFIGTQSMPTAHLSALWDRIALTEREAEILEVMRIIESRVRRIAAISGGSGHPEFVVQLDGDSGRTPLGSMGDGMSRLLALALIITDVPRGGVLLIDEIDTGLHYTVMHRMWRMLIEAARTFDLQVFATSHSLDCLMALSRVTADTAELGPEVSVHRFEVGAPSTVRFDAAELSTAIEHELEVR